VARIIENAEMAGHPGQPEDVRRELAAPGTHRPERWVRIEVVEAYIHCSKHIPLLRKLDKAIHWGTDDVAHKGGDYFRAKQQP